MLEIAGGIIIAGVVLAILAMIGMIGMIEQVQGPDRLSRIEARFERLLVADFSAWSTSASEAMTLKQLWNHAESAESFLESKRAEVKDGK